MAPPAEELPERLADRLAEHVPEREIEGRGAADLGAGRFEADVVLEEAPAVLLDGERVGAEHLRRQRLVDVGGHGRRAEERLAEPDVAGIGVDQHPADVGEFAEGERVDGGDAHGPTLPARPAPIPPRR